MWTLGLKGLTVLVITLFRALLFLTILSTWNLTYLNDAVDRRKLGF